MDGVRRRDAALQRRLDAGAVRHAARAAVVAVESSRVRRRATRSRVQHRRLVHDEHQLAGIQRRVDHELSDADGRAFGWSASLSRERRFAYFDRWNGTLVTT